MRRLLPCVCLSGLLGLLGGGCSLMGYGEFDTRALSDNAACAAVNEHFGLDPAEDCEVYQRVVGGEGCALAPADWDEDGVLSAACADRLDEDEDGPPDCDDMDALRTPGAEETCDGVDNDCDGIVDEGALLAGDTAPVLSELAPDARVAYTHGRDGLLGAVAFVGGGATADLVDPAGEVQGASALDYVSTTAQDDPELAPDPAFNCYQRAFDGVSPLAQCNFATAAADRLGDGRWVVAAVNDGSGCNAGQLRVGHVEPDGQHVVLRGPEQHSNLYLGVDSDAVGQCTGASRPDGEPRGAAAPAVAAFTPDRGDALSQALVAYLADEHERALCGGDAAAVELLGVWLEHAGTRMSEPLRWTNGTGDGMPQRIAGMAGMTRGGGAPAVAAIFKEEGRNRQEGYLLGFGDGEGKLALHFMPNFDDPPAYVLNDLQPTADVRSTPGLALTEADGLTSLRLDVGGAPDHVVLALGAYDADADAQHAGVLWLRDCGPEASLWFAPVVYREGERPVIEAGAPVQLSDPADGGVQPGAALHYQASGFVAPGFARDGEEAGEAGEVGEAGEGSGGFVAAWVQGRGEGATALVRRVLDLDGAPLEATALPVAPAAGPASVALHARGDRYGLVVHTRSDERLHAVPLGCE